MESIFVNTGYGLMLIALAVRDIFWLRVILVFGHSFVLVYSFTTGNYWVAFWNAFFIIINALRILLLWAEKRPCHIPEHLEDLYKNIFSSLHSREFQDFWNMGQLKEACDETIIHNGQKTTALSLILSGAVLMWCRTKKQQHSWAGKICCGNGIFNRRCCFCGCYCTRECGLYLLGYYHAQKP